MAARDEQGEEGEGGRVTFGEKGCEGVGLLRGSISNDPPELEARLSPYGVLP